jgi:hypothetical protein
VPLSDINADGVNSIAVFVQGGDDSKPGRMLGAAVASLR